MLRRAVLLVALVCVPGVASAGPITIDNFESGNLNAWKSGSSGQIVLDPLDAANHVLHFTALGDGGDIWTAVTYAATGNDWWFSFDYLGQPTVPNNVAHFDSGGAIGWDTDQSYAGNERWFGATTPVPVPSADALLIDDGVWHHYVIHLVRGVNLTNGPVYFKAEDWVGSDSVAGNAYFDNIAITDVNPNVVPVPEPGTLLLLATGLGLLVTRRR